LIDVTEGYLSRWEAAKKGEAPGALGLQVMGEALNGHALEFRKLSLEEAIARLKEDAAKMDAIFEALTPEEWTSFLVTHPYMGPVPAGFYPAFQIMDYGIHPYDIEYGLGDKLAEIRRGQRGHPDPLLPRDHAVHRRREVRPGSGHRLRHRGLRPVGRPVARHRQGRRLVGRHYRLIPGGHLFPMESPALAASALHDMIRSLVPERG